MNYYRILDDLDALPNRWFLGELISKLESDIWKYTGIGEVELSQEQWDIAIRKEGNPIDFTFADFDLMVVNEKVKNLISEEEVQFIPVKIKDQSTSDNYYLLVTKYGFDCVDEDKSIFDKWIENDPIRPDKAGGYKTIYRLVVDPNKIPSKHIFRLKKYDVTVIVSETLKRKMEENEIKGIKFKKVSA